MSDTSNIDVTRERSTAPARRTETAPAQMDVFQSMRQEMDRMFDRLWRGAFGVPAFRRMLEPEQALPAEQGFAFTAPAIDFCEDEKSFQLTAELPGLSDKDINVTVSGDMLTITGEKRDEREQKDKNYYWSERQFGSFRRALRLPAHVDRDKIDANFKNGVLSITLPKTAEAMQQHKKIEVKAPQ